MMYNSEQRYARFFLFVLFCTSVQSHADNTNSALQNSYDEGIRFAQHDDRKRHTQDQYASILKLLNTTQPPKISPNANGEYPSNIQLRAKKNPWRKIAMHAHQGASSQKESMDAWLEKIASDTSNTPVSMPSVTLRQGHSSDPVPLGEPLVQVETALQGAHSGATFAHQADERHSKYQRKYPKNTPNFRIFTGHVRFCRRSALHYSNCCHASGWGYQLGVAQCTENEKRLAQARKKHTCIELGTVCAHRFLGACTQHHTRFCCFDTPLAREVQVQGRAQLNLNFGTAHVPHCQGFTPEQFKQLNFDHFSQKRLAGALTSNIHPNNIAPALIDNVKEKQNAGTPPHASSSTIRKSNDLSVRHNEKRNVHITNDTE